MDVEWWSGNCCGRRTYHGYHLRSFLPVWTSLEDQPSWSGAPRPSLPRCPPRTSSTPSCVPAVGKSSLRWFQSTHSPKINNNSTFHIENLRKSTKIWNNWIRIWNFYIKSTKIWNNCIRIWNFHIKSTKICENLRKTEIIELKNEN